jgi:chromate transporter
VNLAAFFAYNVLWPRGIEGAFEWQGLLIGAAAALALFRFKIGIIPIVFSSAGLGVIGASLSTQ